MSDEAAVAEATEEAVAPEAPLAAPVDKSEIYSRIAGQLNKKVEDRFASVASRVKAKHKEDIHMRRVFGDEDGRGLVVGIFNALLDLLMSPNGENEIVEGVTVGLPGGLGSLELLTAGATTKKTPQGKTVEVPKRWRCKWNPGKSVSERLSALPEPAQDDPAATAEAPAAE
jgi:nucleoid DNA-binding protein